MRTPTTGPGHGPRGTTVQKGSRPARMGWDGLKPLQATGHQAPELAAHRPFDPDIYLRNYLGRHSDTVTRATLHSRSTTRDCSAIHSASRPEPSGVSNREREKQSRPGKT